MIAKPTLSIPPEVLTDPLRFKALCWPDVMFYDKQIQIIESVRDNDETFVPAGNMLGKDFVAGFICVWFFLSRSPCRIVTTSAKDDHLRVLWGEINNFINTSEVPLTVDRGGPLIVKHHEINRMLPSGVRCPKSYIRGMVASADSIASMQGHHVANVGDGIPRTLGVVDEASSVPHDYWKMMGTWMKRGLVIGNTWPCENFFKWAVCGRPGTDDPGGDIPRETRPGYYRKVIHIRAADSPNVRLAEAEKLLGKEPSGRMVIQGVKPYDEYLKNVKMWDPIQKCVSLDAEFYEGAEVKLYPKPWLTRATTIRRPAGKYKCYMGVDTGEGGDDTVWTIIDRYGVLHQEAMKTPDTSVIPHNTIDLIKRWGIAAENVLFDKGGGGYEHVCHLRSLGVKVQSVGFGEKATDPHVTKRTKTVKERVEDRETGYVYKNRRAEMYGIARGLLDPGRNPSGFRIPRRYNELLRQLGPLPLLFDEEGRLYLPPKNKTDKNSTKLTIRDMIGCSPDEADSFVLACFSMERVKLKIRLNAR